MSDQDAIQALIPIVTQISGQMVTLTSEVGDLKGEVAEVKATGLATLTQATKTNGRMITAETEITALKQSAAIQQHDEQAEEAREAKDLARRLAWRPLLASAGIGGFITVLAGGVAHFVFGAG
jgi:hypothetical protein